MPSLAMTKSEMAGFKSNPSAFKVRSPSPGGHPLAYPPREGIPKYLQYAGENGNGSPQVAKGGGPV